MHVLIIFFAYACIHAIAKDLDLYLEQMAAEAAALLDQLMGGSRNCLPGEESHQQSWKDGNVCKYFLCGFCPSQLFTNTKADVGEANCCQTMQE